MSAMVTRALELAADGVSELRFLGQSVYKP